MSGSSIKDRIRYRREHAVDPESFLEDVGAIREDETSDDLALSPRFASLIADEVDEFDARGVDESDIARMFGVEDDEVSVPDRPYTAYKVIHTIWNWPSEGALVLDAATDAALRSLTEEWEDVPPRQRYRILQAMRGFHDVCPLCGGSIELGDTLVQSCCSDRTVITVSCNGCDRRLLEFRSEQPRDDGTASAP